MHTAQFKFCKNCNNLHQLLEEVECSIYQFSKNKYTNQAFNTTLHYDIEHFRDLVRFRRILKERIFNPHYPNKCWKEQDLLTYGVRMLYKATGCTPCPCKDFTDFFDTSSTTTSTSSSSTSSTSSSSTTITSSSTTIQQITSTTTTIPEPTLSPIVCGTPQAFAGGQVFPSVIEVVLGTDIGTVVLDYQAFNIPDKFIVRFDGNIVIDTGYVGQASYQSALDANLVARGVSPELIQGPGAGTISFNKDTATSSAFVYIYAPLPNTGWTFTLGCPQ